MTLPNARVLDGLDAALTSAQFYLEPQALVDFYNELAALHDELAKATGELAGDAAGVRVIDVGGQVPGVQAAWTAICQTAGTPRGQGGLLATMSSLDGLVTKHMASALDSIKAYLAHDRGSAVLLEQAVKHATPSSHTPR